MNKNNELIYIDSNAGIDGKPNTHKTIIYQHYRYWWCQENKNSTRYTCCEKIAKKCGASITVSGDKVIRISDCHNHPCLTDAEIIILKETQELKRKVITDFSTSIRSLYNSTREKLISQNVSEKVIQSKLPSFKKQQSTLHKRRKRRLIKINNEVKQKV